MAQTSIVERLLAPRSRPRIVGMIEQHLPDGWPVLDVGCGPRPHIIRPGQIGLDTNPAAVLAYCRFAPAVVGDAANLPFASGHFKGVISVGLLHHLNDAAAVRALGEMMRVTMAGGVICVLDGILSRKPWQTPLAVLIRKLDFGAHMRSAQALETLFDRTGTWQLTLARYASTGLEGLFAVYKKP